MPNKECSGCRGLNYILSQLILQPHLTWEDCLQVPDQSAVIIPDGGAPSLGSLTKKKNEAQRKVVQPASHTSGRVAGVSQTVGKGDTDSGCGRSTLETKIAYLPQVY